MTDQLQMAVNHALNDQRIARARMGLLNPMQGLDTKRPQAWCEYGWPESVSYSQLYSLYRRGGLAHGVVNKLTGKCWETNPWVIEGEESDEATDETQWERKTKRTLTKRLWRTFAEADKRRLVGRYAGLLIHVRDNGKWDQPVTRSGSAIEKLTPAWAGALKPAAFDNDELSKTYGQPTKWQYTEAPCAGRAGRTIDIHPDRVFILGDWTEDAIGFLEPVYNNFVNVEKIEGGAGESFLKNASRQVSVNFDKEVNFQNIASMYGVTVDQLQEKFNDAAREMNRGNDQMLITQGASVAPLVANVADPRPAFETNIQSISAGVNIPSKIIVGMQTGERASTEDQKEFNRRCQSRREDLSFEINDFVRHLQRIKVIDSLGEFAVMWDDLSEQTGAEKLANAKLMSEINQIALAMGEPVFAADEIRSAAGYEAEQLPPLPDEDDDGEVADPAGE